MIRKDHIRKYIKKLASVESPDFEHYVLSLAQRSDFYEEILNLLDDGILIFDARKKITFLNRAFGEIFELKTERLVGRGVDEVFRPLLERQETIIDAEEIALRQSVVKEIRTDFPAGRVFLCKLVPRSFEGEVEYIGLFRDITKMRKAEETRMKSARMGTFSLLAAGIAHEVGNPLSSLSIHLQLMEKKLSALPGKQAAELFPMVNTCLSEIEKLDYILRNFLKTVRPLNPRMSEGDVNALIAEAVKFLEPEVRGTRVEFVLDLDAKLPATMFDPIYIHKAFLNVLKNAVQSIHREGRVRVTTRLRDDRIEVEVADTGEGIDQEALSKLFEPYYTTKKDGTGLGLVMAYKSISEHDGTIEIKSKPGEGTTVVITLPVRKARERYLPPGKNASRAPRENPPAVNP